MNRTKGNLRRVDVQVSIFTAVIVIVSFIAAFTFIYHVTYADMIRSLNERVFSIYDHVQESLDLSTFMEINTKEDQKKQSYQTMKSHLEEIKLATGVRYLYTAKKTDDGEFIYVVDGLDSSAEDFRYPGDLIEPEITETMQRAMEGEIVLPDDIKKTDWGEIFITYFPISYQDRIIGVLGIEFEAQHQYAAYRMIRIVTPIIALVACILAMIFAVKFFKHISNPLHKDLYNTDLLTQLKNKNAYYVDIQNFAKQAEKHTIGVIAADLNHLKQVNDRFGHAFGDQYILTASEAIRSALSKNDIAYRTGGDEFMILSRRAAEEDCLDLMENIRKNFEQNGPAAELALSIAMGYAVYDPSVDHELTDTCHRADKNMYENKHKDRQG